MSLNLYAIARPILFNLDPEDAHDLTLQQLARTQNTFLDRAYPVSYTHLTLPTKRIV